MENRKTELIDRHKIIEKIEPWLYSVGRGESELNMLRAVIEELKEAAAIDAEPVVRCKDCQYYDYAEICNAGRLSGDENGYCHEGVRRSGGIYMNRDKEVRPRAN